MADLKNELVWSHSRARLFKKCLRAYWFAYYGSWGGWDERAPRLVRDAYVQKKLSNRAQWIGLRVHRAAERALAALEQGWPIEEDEAIRMVERQIEDDLEGSASGRWLQRPSRRMGLREHYYREEVSPEAWQAARAELLRQVRALYAHRVFRRLWAVPERIREVEELRRFSVEGVEVYGALDVLVADGHGGVVIIDWKTGDGHDDAEIAAQLGVYGLYAHGELGVPEDRITAMHVNLRTGAETRHPVGPAAMERARRAIVGGMAEMRGRLANLEANVARAEDHPPLPEGDPACVGCTFRGVCGRG